VNAIHQQPEIIGVRHTSGSAEVTDRATALTIYQATCEVHNRPVRYDHQANLGQHAAIPCPDGGHQLDGRRLVVVASNVTCDGSCWAATSDRCSCACGGINHGRSWMISSAFTSMSDEALTEAWRGARISTREVFEDELAKWRAARQQAAEKTTARRERAKATRERKARTRFDDWAASHQAVIEGLRPLMTCGYLPGGWDRCHASKPSPPRSAATRKPSAASSEPAAAPGSNPPGPLVIHKMTQDWPVNPLPAAKSNASSKR
jgi:hypothetical protein